MFLIIHILHDVQELKVKWRAFSTVCTETYDYLRKLKAVSKKIW